jgi:hypothetical protein
MSQQDPPPVTIDPATGRPVADKVAGVPKVRPAGPEGMEDPPQEIVEDWDETDQASDESFPASDPPGQGVG